MTSLTPREPVFAARNRADETAAEQALEEAGIEYAITTGTTEKADGAVCFLSIVYEVAAADAQRARAILEARGLGASVFPPR